MEKKTKIKIDIFREEIKQSYTELSEALREIYNRLVKDGKVKVVDGKVYFLENGKWVNPKLSDGSCMKEILGK